MIFKNDPNKHGFYEVNGFRTFSKLEAIEIQNRTGYWPYWNFNDDIYGKQQWAVDPALSLVDLYKARCRQIRESYDYVVMFYSGGSDSVNILNYWIEEDLKIDEIASFWNVDGTKDPNVGHLNEEINRVVIPGVQRLKDKGLEFKFRLIDITQYTEPFIYEAGYDWAYFTNNHFSPNNHSKLVFRDKIKDYSDMIAQGKSVCFLWGCEKPQIFPEGNRHYLQFFDIMDYCVTPYTQQRMKQGWYDELFYWTPDMPELIVKQAHTLLKFVETCDMQEFYQDKPNRYGYNRRLNKYVTSAAAKIILYPKWDPTTFVNGKPSNFIYSERDAWFWKGNMESVEFLRSLSIQYFEKIGSFWMNDPNDILKGIKCHCSPKYYLN
jgi:hypothetical protein